MLKKIREKPHHEKQIIAGVITVIIFSGIVFVWGSSRDARSQEVRIQVKTVSPIDGVTSMFSGFISGLKEKISKSSVQDNADIRATTTEPTFDLSGVVIVDPSTEVATTTSMELTAQKSLLPTGQATATTTVVTGL